MKKKIEIYTLTLLFIFTAYCALTIGTAWDELYEILRGNERLKYLFSLGSFENYWKEQNDQFYPGFYTTIASFFTKMFPKKYEFEVWHLVNTLFSILTIFGIYRISKILFNKQVGKIVFLLCFFNPIFFGHMAINPKDTIIAFSHVWTTYIFLKYLQQQNFNKNCNQLVLIAGITVGLGTGVRIPFILTLSPLFIFAVIDIFFLKSITNKYFSYKKFIFHLIAVLIIAYLITISFWPHAHVNIFTEPFKLVLNLIEGIGPNASQIVGLPWMLFDGNFVETNNPPNSYLIVTFFYKSPEFILLCYIFFIYFAFTNKKFFVTKFSFFWNKVSLILFIFLFPIIYFIISPYIIYDGLRLVLYLIPYFVIIPALAIYYMINNFHSVIPKILLGIVSIFFAYYVYIFILLTPYQYTYLNRLNGDFKKAYEKYENDYWGASIKELVKKIPNQTNLISNGKKIKIIFCGSQPHLGEKELEKLKNFKFDSLGLNEKDFDYVIMTNKVVVNDNIDGSKKVMTCYDKFIGNDIVTVKRNGLMLSTLRKKIK